MLGDAAYFLLSPLSKCEGLVLPRLLLSLVVRRV